jgi:hypothetical protein
MVSLDRTAMEDYRAIPYRPCMWHSCHAVSITGIPAVLATPQVKHQVKTVGLCLVAQPYEAQGPRESMTKKSVSKSLVTYGREGRYSNILFVSCSFFRDYLLNIPMVLLYRQLKVPTSQTFTMTSAMYVFIADSPLVHRIQQSSICYSNAVPSMVTPYFGILRMFFLRSKGWPCTPCIRVRAIASRQVSQVVSGAQLSSGLE